MYKYGVLLFFHIINDYSIVYYFINIELFFEMLQLWVDIFSIFSLGEIFL